ncbi:hypothetical protein [Terrilactibacillus laevilacticus]|uniref:hypothetical protein n=1 Tax=Terrilactibacillus laevilacticus TaxID=1380157 RepID=UPI001146E1BA|nr:hypothetical protein [Terrilactibacillus laevilacticus]
MEIFTYLNIKDHVILYVMTLILKFLFIKKTLSRNFSYQKHYKKNELLMEVLYKKYYDTMENDHVIDEDVLEDEYLEISKKRRQHLEVILSLQHLM